MAGEGHGFTGPPDRASRVHAFAEAYGLRGTAGIVDRVVDRQKTTLARIADLAERGHEP